MAPESVLRNVSDVNPRTLAVAEFATRHAAGATVAFVHTPVHVQAFAIVIRAVTPANCKFLCFAFLKKKRKTQKSSYAGDTAEVALNRKDAVSWHWELAKAKNKT